MVDTDDSAIIKGDNKLTFEKNTQYIVLTHPLRELLSRR